MTRVSYIPYVLQRGICQSLTSRLPRPATGLCSARSGRRSKRRRTGNCAVRNGIGAHTGSRQSSTTVAVVTEQAIQAQSGCYSLVSCVHSNTGFLTGSPPPARPFGRWFGCLNNTNPLPRPLLPRTGPSDPSNLGTPTTAADSARRAAAAATAALPSANTCSTYPAVQVSTWLTAS